MKIVLSLSDYRSLSVLDEVINLLVNIFALFSLFLRLISLNLLLLLIMLSLGCIGQSLFVFLILLLDVLLDLAYIVLFLLIHSLGDKLMIINNVITVVSSALLAELDWVLIISDVLRVIIVIEMAMELKVLEAALVFFLSIGSFHLLILLFLFLYHHIGLVLKVSSPHLFIITLVHMIMDLDEIEVALTLLWCGSGTISLIGVWNIVRVVIVVGDLNHLIVIKLSSLSLNVIALVILVEESIIVAIWGQLGIVQFLMIVSNSLHVLWSIDDLWVVR